MCRFKILYEISKVPYEIYEVLKIWRLMISQSYDCSCYGFCFSLSMIDMMFCSKYINARHGNAVWIIDPLWGKSTGHHWIPLTRGMSFSWSTLFFLLSDSTVRYYTLLLPCAIAMTSHERHCISIISTDSSTACSAKEASMLCITCHFLWAVSKDDRWRRLTKGQ